MPEESVKLFISYCHRDEKLREQLDKHLSPLKGQKIIEAWHDRQIRAGDEWANQIDDNLNKQYSGHFLRQRLKPAFHRWYLPQ